MTATSGAAIQLDAVDIRAVLHQGDWVELTSIDGSRSCGYLLHEPRPIRRRDGSSDYLLTLIHEGQASRCWVREASELRKWSG